MKTSLRFLFFIGLSILIAVSFAGCSKEAGPDKSVDVSAMITALKSPDKDARENACVELAKAKESAAPAVTGLIELLKHSEPETRRLAAYALQEIGPKAAAAIPALQELLNDSERTVITQVINSLRSIDPKSVPAENVPNVELNLSSAINVGAF
ncbi:MAG: HEAT repeat domain-containing protein, partial [Verrucomicrobiota bacterium]